MITSRTAFAALIVVLTSACAPSRFYISLAPQPPAAPAVTAVAIPVVVSVEDARSNPAFGKRGDADLLSNQDIPTVLRTALVTNLQQRGYSVRDTADADTVGITITVRTLTLNAQMNKWDAKAELGARVNKGMSDYKGNYAVEKEGKVVLTPSVKDSETWMNETLNEALAKMFSDGNFMKFLAQ